jgi:hypothetical protein
MEGRRDYLILKYGSDAVTIAEIAWGRFNDVIAEDDYQKKDFEAMCWCGWAAIHKIQL